jgi:hypothetical protein
MGALARSPQSKERGTHAKRVQRRRTKGWRKPRGAVCVDRTSRWGNPYEVDEYGRELAVKLYRWLLARPELPEYRQAIRTHLAGKTLACYCKPDETCHEDVLLELANP